MTFIERRVFSEKRNKYEYLIIIYFTYLLFFTIIAIWLPYIDVGKVTIPLLSYINLFGRISAKYMISLYVFGYLLIWLDMYFTLLVLCGTAVYLCIHNYETVQKIGMPYSLRLGCIMCYLCIASYITISLIRCASYIYITITKHAMTVNNERDM